MKKILFLVLILLMWPCFAREADPAKLTGMYLGQKPPGTTPESSKICGRSESQNRGGNAKTIGAVQSQLDNITIEYP